MVSHNITSLLISLAIFVNIVYCGPYFDPASWFPYFFNQTQEQFADETPLVQTEKWIKGDFEMYEKLGEGGFGVVWRAMSMKDKKVYAIKKILAGKDTEAEIGNEVALQRKLKSNFVVQIYNVFKDSTAYYLQLELAEGGDLFDLMNSLDKRFSEVQARFYTAEILCALEFIHNNDVIFRDLKPENILLTKSGHIKIGDFGLAKEMRSDERAYEECGTAEYEAPEMIQGKPYNKLADSWSLGLVMYVMLTGYHPFYAAKTNEICANILRVKIIYHKGYFSRNAKDLLTHLLDRNAEKRYNMARAKKHAWFFKTDWTKVENQQYGAPFRPEGNRYYYFENNQKKFVERV